MYMYIVLRYGEWKEFSIFAYVLERRPTFSISHMFYCYRTNGEKLFPSRTSIPRLHYTVTALQFEEYKPQRRRPDDDDQGGGWGRPKTAQRTFINFTSAKQRHLTTQVASKARQRGVQLAQIIELDVAKYVTV